MADYSEAWSTYRQLRNRALIVFPGFFPVLILVDWIASKLSGEKVAGYIRAILFFGWMLAAVITSATAQAWRCPRCGKRFAEKWWYHRGIFFARSCAYCGLKKYAQY